MNDHHAQAAGRANHLIHPRRHEGYALRCYPSAVGSYVTGYYSPQLYGLAGLESAYDPYLRGVDGLFHPGGIPAGENAIHFRAARKLRELI